MLGKPPLIIYRGNEAGIEEEPILTTPKGGAPLQARSGVLRTRALRAKFTEGLDRTCKQAKETVCYVVLKCTEVEPPAAVAGTQDPDVSAFHSAVVDV